jgi:hypothetical protein
MINFGCKPIRPKLLFATGSLHIYLYVHRKITLGFACFLFVVENDKGLHSADELWGLVCFYLKRESRFNAVGINNILGVRNSVPLVHGDQQTVKSFALFHFFSIYIRLGGKKISMLWTSCKVELAAYVIRMNSTFLCLFSSFWAEKGHI